MAWPGRYRGALIAVVRPALISAGLVVLYYVVPMKRQVGLVDAIELIAGIAGVAALLAFHTVAVTRSRYPRLRAVEALATSVTLFLLLFAAGYFLLELDDSQAFTETLTRTDALYFAITVFSTVGFGDIAAITETARIVTMVQMVLDLVLVGVAARVLLSAVQVGIRRRTPEGQEEGKGE